MNTCDLKDTLVKLFRQPSRKTVVALFGAPGVGKTSIVGEAAEDAGKPVKTFALPTCEAVDLRGLPHIKDGRTEWASPMPREGEGVVLLDELSSAPPDVQVAAHHLVWAEAGSDMSLPPGWHIVLTGNRAQDKTLHRATSGPLRNRMTLLDIEVDPAQWTNWAMSNALAPEVISFIRWRPELLTCKEVPASGAFTSPRSWHRASDILSLNVSASVEREMLEGTVGAGAVTEFTAHLRTCRELPSIQAILEKQDEAEVPKSPSLLYALTTCLAQHTRSSQESASEYVSRMPAEFGMLYIRDIRDYYDITTDKHIRTWIGKHKSLFKDIG